MRLAAPRHCGAGVLLGLLAFCAFADPVVIRTANASAMESGPIWVSRATWDAAEERLIVADPGSARIYVYEPSGKIERRIANPGQGKLEFTTPNYAFLIGNRYLIAATPFRWIWFNKDLVPESAWELDWEVGEGAYGKLIPGDIAFSSTHLYTVGETMSFKGEWSQSAIFAVSLKDRTVQKIARLAKDEDERSYYLEPPFNLAACGGKAWLLQMTPTVRIVEARDGGKRLNSFPSEFQKRPSLPAVPDAYSLPARGAARRNATVAEGLFCVDDRVLLLLAHKPRTDGGVQWLVYPIDPVRDAIGNAIELPTSAGEIVFVPGRKRWAILEKGIMKHAGVQPLTRMISFPRPALNADKARTAP